jgi:hypothetical protein
MEKDNGYETDTETNKIDINKIPNIKKFIKMFTQLHT